MAKSYEPIHFVPISDDLAQALWAAMRDDDELAEDYVELCVIHGLLHLTEQVKAEHYSPEKWARIHEYLEISRRNARALEDSMQLRFLSYDDVPF